MYLYNYGGLPVVRIFQLYLMFFTGVIIPTPSPFMGLNGPNWSQKMFFCLILQEICNSSGPWNLRYLIFLRM